MVRENESEISRQKRLDGYKKYKEKIAGKFKRVSTTFSLSEYKKLKTEAQRHGLKPTTFLKKLWQEKQKKGVLIPVEQEKKLQEAIFLIHNIANNLNQIAHVANSNKKTSFSAVDSLKILQQLESDVKKVLTE